MSGLLETGLSNAVMATVLALLVASLALVCRRPAVLHGLWLLVLLKLITPPLVSVPLPNFQAPAAVAPPIVPHLEEADLETALLQPPPLELQAQEVVFVPD